MLSILGFLFGVSASFQFFDNHPLWEVPGRFSPKIKHVYLPIGFDNEDRAQILVEVELKDSCQEMGRAIVIPHEDFPNILQIIVEAHTRKGGECIKGSDYPIEPITVGFLPEGTYQVVDFNNLEKVYGFMTVRPTGTNTIDDSNYAPVTSLFVHRDPSDPTQRRRYLTLNGTFPNACMKIMHEKVRIEKTGPGLIEVLPMVTKTNDEKCPDRPTPFMETYEIPDDRDGDRRIHSGRYLFHVRTAHGQSFNKIDYVVMEENATGIPD